MLASAMHCGPAMDGGGGAAETDDLLWNTIMYMVSWAASRPPSRQMLRGADCRTAGGSVGRSDGRTPDCLFQHYSRRARPSKFDRTRRLSGNEWTTDERMEGGRKERCSNIVTARRD